MEGTAHTLWGAASGFTGVLKTAAGRLGALALLAAVPAAPLAAISASTAPMGFVRATVAAAESSASHTPSLIATPLLQAPVFTGRFDRARAASGAVELIHQPGTPMRPDCFDAGRPHAVFVTSGVFSGFVFRVRGNGPEGIRVDAQGFELGEILAPGDRFEVRPLHTFKSLFGADAATVPFTAAEDAAHADQLMICRDGVWRAYWFTGSIWRRTGAPGDAGEDALLPQDGIVVYRRATSAVAVRFVGEAPATDAVLSMPAGAVSAIANPFPTDAAIGEFGFEVVSGWQCHPRHDQADQVQVRTAGAWRTFWHDGQDWRDSAGLATPLTIPAGTAMIVVRRASAAANPFALVARPYDL